MHVCMHIHTGTQACTNAHPSPTHTQSQACTHMPATCTHSRTQRESANPRMHTNIYIQTHTCPHPHARAGIRTYTRARSRTSGRQAASPTVSFYHLRLHMHAWEAKELSPTSIEPKEPNTVLSHWEITVSTYNGATPNQRT